MKNLELEFDIVLKQAYPNSPEVGTVFFRKENYYIPKNYSQKISVAEYKNNSTFFDIMPLKFTIFYSEENKIVKIRRNKDKKVFEIGDLISHTALSNKKELVVYEIAGFRIEDSNVMCLYELEDGSLGDLWGSNGIFKV